MPKRFPIASLLLILAATLACKKGPGDGGGEDEEADPKRLAQGSDKRLGAALRELGELALTYGLGKEPKEGSRFICSQTPPSTSKLRGTIFGVPSSDPAQVAAVTLHNVVVRGGTECTLIITALPDGVAHLSSVRGCAGASGTDVKGYSFAKALPELRDYGYYVVETLRVGGSFPPVPTREELIAKHGGNPGRWSFVGPLENTAQPPPVSAETKGFEPIGYGGRMSFRVSIRSLGDKTMQVNGELNLVDDKPCAVFYDQAASEVTH